MAAARSPRRWGPPRGSARGAGGPLPERGDSFLTAQSCRLEHSGLVKLWQRLLLPVAAPALCGCLARPTVSAGPRLQAGPAVRREEGHPVASRPGG